MQARHTCNVMFMLWPISTCETHTSESDYIARKQTRQERIYLYHCVTRIDIVKSSATDAIERGDG